MQRVRVQIACPKTEPCIVEPCIAKSHKAEPVTIGYLDTGIKKHPDFAERIVAFHDFVNKRTQAYDDSGHGTHVCGIAAGDGRLSEGKYCGIAPFSQIVMGKVLDENGDGLADQMIAGLDWMMEIREQYHVKIINISVGIGNLKDKKKQQELVEKVEEVCETGILVVCAAGNLGPKRGSLSPLGVSRKVLTVGCHDGDFFRDYENRCETYSGRGPGVDTIKKPDIVAPGTEIISCNAFFYQKGKKHSVNSSYQNAYIAKSGTSMATAIVSAGAAILWQRYPDLTREQVKRKLLYSAIDLGEPWIKQGWGMLNIERALRY